MSDEMFYAINPATGERLEPGVREAGEQEVDAALKLASQALEVIADRPPRWSAALLDAIAAKVMDLGDRLLERAEAETALPRPRLIGERARTTGQLKLFAEIVREGSWVDAVIDTADPARTPAPRPDLRRMSRPRGAVAVFGASNFPFAFGVVGGDTASALAAGCPVVVKGHPSHPGTSELFAAAVRAALEESRLPAGLFALLQGRGHALSGLLVRHPGIAAVGFTGSNIAGRALFDLAAARPSPIPVYAEMGSINPLVALPGAISERGAKLAEGICGSVLLGGGQFCTKPGVIFAVGDQTDGFVQRLAGIIGHAPAVTMLNPQLRDNFFKRVQTLQYIDGVGALDVPDEPLAAAGTAPALFQTDAQTWQREPMLREETFGPTTLVIHCKDVPELLECIDRVDGSLTGTVHVGQSDDAGQVRSVVRRLEERVGRVVLNGYPTGVEVNNAIVHGGPYPATTDPGATSVGSAAIRRWVRMVAYQDMPDTLLPPALQNDNPLGIERVIDGRRTRDALRAENMR